MQKGRVLSLKRFSIFENLKTNTFLITITLLFTIGLLIGVFSQNDFLFLKNFSTEYIAEYISLRNAEGFGNIFLNSLLNFLREIFVLFLLGTSFFGIVTVPLVLIFKGIILG
ncbi:MAG: stage II sporulation protein M, partial [Acutalibacteraceae bacterium]|nr:stage II sporulation protein M [Acutalibacteraceae bacterium]